MYNVTMEIGNVTITGPIGEVAKFLSGGKRSKKVKVRARNGAEKKKRAYKKKNAAYWAKKEK